MATLANELVLDLPAYGNNTRMRNFEVTISGADGTAFSLSMDTGLDDVKVVQVSGNDLPSTVYAGCNIEAHQSGAGLVTVGGYGVSGAAVLNLMVLGPLERS